MTVETSPDLAQFAEALAKAQGQIKNAAKTSANLTFASSYADLASVWDACREALSSNGIAVVQMPTCDGEAVEVTTTLLHASGQWMRSTLWLPVERNDAQGAGSAISYARRYSLAAIVGVAQADDDGEAASAPGPTRIGGFSRAEGDGIHATPAQLATLEEMRTRAGIPVCDDITGPCPWKTSKWSKREGRSIEKNVMCEHHAELFQWKTAKQEGVRNPADLTFEQADLLVAKYRKKAERRERRAAQTPDIVGPVWKRPFTDGVVDDSAPLHSGEFRPVGTLSVGCDPPGSALFVGDAIRPRADGTVEQLERGLLLEGDMRTGALRVVGPVDGHATMPRAELDAGTVLRALAQSDMTEVELCALFGVEDIGDLTYGDIPDALCLIGDYGTERYDLTVAKLREKHNPPTQENV